MVTINVSARSAYFSEPDIKINLSIITYLELACNVREKYIFIGTSLNLERVIFLGSLMQYLFISVRVTLVMKHHNQIHTGEKRNFFFYLQLHFTVHKRRKSWQQLKLHPLIIFEN